VSVGSLAHHGLRGPPERLVAPRAALLTPAEVSPALYATRLHRDVLELQRD
jgi:hypothetical protein